MPRNGNHVPYGRRARRDKETDLEKALKDTEFKRWLLSPPPTEPKKQSTHKNEFYACDTKYKLKVFRNVINGTINNYVFDLYKISGERVGHLRIDIGHRPVVKTAHGIEIEYMFSKFSSYIKAPLTKHYTEEAVANFLKSLKSGRFTSVL